MSDSLTLSQAREAVLARWKAIWDVAHPTIPYWFENVKTTPTTAPWARVTMRTLNDVQQTLGAPGSRTFRREAAVWVQLFGNLAVGSLELDALVPDVRAAFEGASFGGVTGVGGARVSYPGSDGLWYEVVVVCPVTYYETR